MKNLPNMPKNVTFRFFENGRIRVHPQPLYIVCIIIKYNINFNIMDEHECGHFHFRPSSLAKGYEPLPLSRNPWLAKMILDRNRLKFV